MRMPRWTVRSKRNNIERSRKMNESSSGYETQNCTMPQATAIVPLKMPMRANFDWCLIVYNRCMGGKSL